ncbi:MAG: alpha/beta hydrolase-fold protein, partial [Methylacidiphilales bacterium]|nr:alpha/beta hydrolase-fold protein [Candidatus Methylacidiphilales bacterium]
MKHNGLAPLLFLLPMPLLANLLHPHTTPHVFTITQDVGIGNSVFVTGNVPELGNNMDLNNLTNNSALFRAHRLRWTTGNVWTATVALPRGKTIQYRLVSRPDSVTGFCNHTTTALTPVLTLNTPPPPPAPYKGKTVFYLTGWNQAHILYRKPDGTFTSQPMIEDGPGRTPSEKRFRISGIGQAGDTFEFVFHNGQGQWDNAPVPHPGWTAGGYNYMTSLDVLWVQDGQVFNYEPPASLSAPTVVTIASLPSTIQDIPSRRVRIYLPRGYTQNTWKKYPVLYMHDGQNVFQGEGAFGNPNNSWFCDTTATREIGQGRMRELIIVAVDNGNPYGSDRLYEYRPPGEPTNVPPFTQNKADKYAQYLIQNVKAYVDANYRTLSDAGNTFTMGSSMGGLVSMYLGWAHSQVFGNVGAVSPAYWPAQNFLNTMSVDPKRPIRIYTDMGTAESSANIVGPTNWWNSFWAACNHHLADNYIYNDDL